MTEAEWLACDSPVQMVRSLQHRASARRLRLWACAFYRCMYPNNGATLAGVETAERWAEGETPKNRGMWAEFIPCDKFGWRAAERTAMTVDQRWSDIAGRSDAWICQLALLRCIFGNPFRPVAFAPAWRSETAVALASAIYAERAFDRLPILADALEEAGCDHADVLTHCRGPGPHARGCWVVDGVLGKA